MKRKWKNPDKDPKFFPNLKNLHYSSIGEQGKRRGWIQDRPPFWKPARIGRRNSPLEGGENFSSEMPMRKATERRNG
jgi:hypothetical protein